MATKYGGRWFHTAVTRGNVTSLAAAAFAETLLLVRSLGGIKWVSFLSPGQDFSGLMHKYRRRRRPYRNKFMCCSHPRVQCGRQVPSRKLFTKEQMSFLLNFALKVLARDEVGDLVVVSLLFTLLHVLVALGELAERGKRVRSKLVEDARNQLRELLIFAVAIDGKGVCGHRGVNCET